MELSRLKNKKFQEGTLRARKINKTNKQTNKIRSEEISFISPNKVLLTFCDGC